MRYNVLLLILLIFAFPRLLQAQVEVTELGMLYDLPIFESDSPSVVVGDQLYISGRQSEGIGVLHVYDISEPTSPSFLRSDSLEAGFFGLAAWGTTLFSFTGNTFTAYDASNSEYLTVVGTLPVTITPVDIKIGLGGGLACYIGYNWETNQDAIVIIDIATPTSMAIHSIITNPMVYHPHFSFAGSYLLVSSYFDQHTLIDLSDPDAPVQISLELPDTGFEHINQSKPCDIFLTSEGDLRLYWGIAYEEEMMYQSSLLTLDASNPEELEILDIQFAHSDHFYNHYGQVQNQRFIHSDGGSGVIHYYPLDEDGIPIYLGYTRAHNVDGITFNNGKMVVSDDVAGVMLYEDDGEGVPDSLTSVTNSRLSPLTVDKARNLVYFYDSWNIRCVDVSDPSVPIELSSFPIGQIEHALAYGNVLLVQPFQHVTSYAVGIDYSDPLNPEALGEWDQFRFRAFGDFPMLAGEGDYLLHWTVNDSLQVYSTESFPPSMLHSIHIPMTMSDIRSATISGDYLFVVQPLAVLRTYDLAHGAEEVAESLESGNIYDLHAEGNVLLASGSPNYRSFDISDPTDIRLLSSLPAPDAEEADFLLGQDWMGTVSSSGELTLFDYRQPQFPVIMTSIIDSGLTYFGPSPDHLFACSSNRFYTFRLDRPEMSIEEERASNLPYRFAIENIYPNPFNGQTTVTLAFPAAGLVKMELFNLLGQRVYAHQVHVGQSGLHHHSLQLESLSGGQYFLRMEGPGGEVAARRITLIK
ncbi:T9SS type A sorting domain-containing protein [bacterium]|nr:T9SS type A sorting domain-containing protein [bacterium]